MQDYRNFRVWERAHALLLEIYRVSSGFPAEERFTLTSQLRRAALSVPTNLAEGCGRSSGKELRRFVDFSSGSAKEVEYLLRVAHDLDYLGIPDHTRLLAELESIQKMLRALHNRLSD